MQVGDTVQFWPEGSGRALAAVVLAVEACDSATLRVLSPRGADFDATIRGVPPGVDGDVMSVVSHGSVLGQYTRGHWTERR